MTLFIKKHHSKAAKIVGTIFFVVLLFVNMKIDSGANTDIDFLGLKLAFFTPSAYAAGCDKPCYWDNMRATCTVFPDNSYCIDFCGYPAEINCRYNGPGD